MGRGKACEGSPGSTRSGPDARRATRRSCALSSPTGPPRHPTRSSWRSHSPAYAPSSATPRNRCARGSSVGRAGCLSTGSGTKRSSTRSTAALPELRGSASPARATVASGCPTSSETVVRQLGSSSRGPALDAVLDPVPREDEPEREAGPAAVTLEAAHDGHVPYRLAAVEAGVLRSRPRIEDEPRVPAEHHHHVSRRVRPDAGELE